MDNAKTMRSIIERCRDALVGLNPGIRSGRLLDMCDRLLDEIDSWKPTDTPHRPLDFLRCALISNQVIDVATASEFLPPATISDRFARDLIDHLDPESAFEFDIGGEG